MNLTDRVEKLEQVAAGGRDGQGCDLCAGFASSASGDDLASERDYIKPFNCARCGRRAVVVVNYVEKWREEK
jgi:hypothetical protein